MSSGASLKKVFIGISGASGSLYAERLLRALLPLVERIYLCASEVGLKVLLHETKGEPSLLKDAFAKKLTSLAKEKIRVFAADDFFAPVASGSNAADAVILVPCSMGMLGRVASGASTNLIERTADVALKQRRPLIVVARETPLSLIHLRNMVALTEAGAIVVPAMPAFYQRPQTFDDLGDFMAGRVLEILNLGAHELYPRWATERE